MKKVAVIIGHSPARPGFSIGKHSEYSEMAPVAGLLVRALMYDGIHAYMIGSGGKRQKIDAINRANVDLAIELHLNAGGGEGIETLYCPGSTKGKKLAKIIHKSIKDINPRDRGIKAGWYRQDPERGPVYFLSYTNCPAIITETYFLDNQISRQNFSGNLQFYTKLAEKLAAGIKLYLEV